LVFCTKKNLATLAHEATGNLHTDRISSNFVFDADDEMAICRFVQTTYKQDAYLILADDRKIRAG
jgi:hypothetical protein